MDSLIFRLHGMGFSLSCYDIEKDNWHRRKYPPSWLGGAHPVVINKDIYYVNEEHCACYSTINDTWTTLTPPPKGNYHALRLQGNLVLCPAHESTSEFPLKVYDTKTNTWKTRSLNLPEGLRIKAVYTM